MQRNKTQSSLLYVGPKLYNRLPLDIKRISLRIFKKINK